MTKKTERLFEEPAIDEEIIVNDLAEEEEIWNAGAEPTEETPPVEETQKAQLTHVRLLIYYRGRLTNEAVIPPGDYAIDDPALLGLGRYLISIGVAEEV